MTYKREEVSEELTEEDLNKNVTINLSETETIWLLDMAGICVSLESEEAVAVREQNARYQEVGGLYRLNVLCDESYSLCLTNNN